MKVARFREYGGPEVVSLVEAERPSPQAGELLVQVQASTVSRVDSIFRSGRDGWARLFTGWRRPKAGVLGTELAGVVVELGEGVTDFSLGDEVVASPAAGMGAHAELVCLGCKDAVVKKPEGLSFEEAATLCNGGLTALPFLRDVGGLRRGQRVLVIGAAGSIGSMAVQLAAGMGAKVTGVCSEANGELVRELGATEVVDYREPWAVALVQRFDLIFDTVGKSSFSECQSLLSERGSYLTTVISLRALWDGLRTRLWGRQRARFAATGMRSREEQRQDLERLCAMVEKGTLRPLIDRSFDFSAVREAHAYLDSGRKKGNVVLRMAAA